MKHRIKFIIKNSYASVFLIMCLSLSGCSSTTDENTDNNSDSNSSEESFVLPGEEFYLQAALDLVVFDQFTFTSISELSEEDTLALASIVASHYISDIETYQNSDGTYTVPTSVLEESFISVFNQSFPLTDISEVNLTTVGINEEIYYKVADVTTDTNESIVSCSVMFEVYDTNNDTSLDRFVVYQLDSVTLDSYDITSITTP